MAIYISNSDDKPNLRFQLLEEAARLECTHYDFPFKHLSVIKDRKIAVKKRDGRLYVSFIDLYWSTFGIDTELSLVPSLSYRL